MEKIGKTFTRDMEFTGSCDVSMPNNASRLMKNLSRRGFNVPGEGKPFSSRDVGFGSVQTFSDEDDGTCEIALTEEQMQLAEDVTGKRPTHIRISVCSNNASGEIEFNEEQQKAIDEALGMELDSLTIERTPVETELIGW